MFQNKTVLVLAGAQGIGKACSLLVASQGANVYTWLIGMLTKQQQQQKKLIKTMVKRRGFVLYR